MKEPLINSTGADESNSDEYIPFVNEECGDTMWEAVLTAMEF